MIFIQSKFAMIRTFVFSLSLFFLNDPVFVFSSQNQIKLKLLDTQKIWDQGAHNAFTGLTRYQDQFFCVFREAEGHVSPAGTIRILHSKDGKDWSSAGLLQLEGYDLRDPKICVHPNGKLLYILGGAAVREGHQRATKHQSFICTSSNGTDWGPIEWIAEEGQWLWRITWFGKKAYGVAYDVRPQSREQRNFGTSLLYSENGKEYETLVADLYNKSGPTEATLRFDREGTCYCLQRRDGRETNTALLGTSQSPFTKWQWKDLGIYFGGPNFIQIPTGEWIATGRIITEEGARTVVCQLDVQEGKLQPLVTLPSGGDTSYPGMAWHDEKLWISYYSSHEGKTSIYFARIMIGQDVEDKK